ncbi:MAG: flagellar hook-length control protein FliK [Hyphomicrobiales bacterium]|nr:flagellar hook-length control protein FliK [Hyphomicrobiales bacterium]
MNPITALITNQTGSPVPGGTEALTGGPSKIGQFAKLLGVGPDADQLLADGVPVDPLAIISSLSQPAGLPEALPQIEGSPVPPTATTISDPLLASIEDSILASPEQDVETADTAPANILPDPELAGSILPDPAAAAPEGGPDSVIATAPEGAVVSAPGVAENPDLPVIPAGSTKPTQPGERGAPATPGVVATPAVPADAARPPTPQNVGKPETGEKPGTGQAAPEAGSRPTPGAQAAASATPPPPQLDRNLQPQQPTAVISQPGAKPQQNSQASDNPGRPVALASADSAPGRNESTRPIVLPPQPAVATTVLNSAAGQAILQGSEQPDTGTTNLAAIEAGKTGVQMRAASPAHTGQTPQLPVNSLAVHIAQQAQNGLKRFNIRLDPPELGRLEIRLDLTRKGQVTTHLIVERAETLDLLQRDARALERALQNAGLDTSEGGMKFSLKDQGLAHDASQDHNNESAQDASNADADDASSETEAAAHYAARYVATSGLDMRI